MNIEVLDTIDSTNSYLKNEAKKGLPEGYTVIAKHQTAGRGRLGRSFYSPTETGLYMSILLRPRIVIERAISITTIAAVAVCEAIENITDEKPMIKWVNDVLIDKKKICGILTETSIDTTGRIDMAVLGIGINVCRPKGGFPDEIKDIAGYIFENCDDEMVIRLGKIVRERFLKYYQDIEKSHYNIEYKKRSLVIGRKISVITGDTICEANAIDIDDECHLIVRYDDGKTEVLSTGEVSIRL